MATSTAAFHSRANGHANPTHHEVSSQLMQSSELQHIPPQYLPGGRKSLPGISIRAFCLGIAFGMCTLAAFQLAYFGHELWRVPSFVATLAVFHYLEFDMTARFNPPDGKVSSFLLFNNGAAYTIAHTSAMIETITRYWLGSVYHLAELCMPSVIGKPSDYLRLPSTASVSAGFMLIVIGQIMRSLAMAHAKTNFNHVVQNVKKSDHVLITDGVYAFSRHPSYFGFFWWGLGTQLMLGNPICFVAYAVLLWQFFNHRIRGEEKHLIEFFGQSYLLYKSHVGVWIPFIH